MGLLTDLWKTFCDFFEIEAVEPIVPETKEPPKPLEPVKSETPLPEKPSAIAPIEPVEPLPSEPISEPTSIGEQGRADRIEVLPAKTEPEPEREREPFTGDNTFRIQRGNGTVTPETGQPVEGVNVQVVGVGSCVTDSKGACTIRNIPFGSHDLILSKAGYVTNRLRFTLGEERGSASYYIDKEGA